ncbi:hypothetical protein [Streptomyces sp. NPDC090025]|uniref:hypothetical protein n=1 Tax=Streptomyces sp. NPDC090025 TaxID=3365922 RepID=UPI0038355D65
MTAGIRIRWALTGAGWADCVLEGHGAKAELSVSSLSEAPEELLTAVARLVGGAAETRAQFEAEPPPPRA